MVSGLGLGVSVFQFLLVQPALRGARQRHSKDAQDAGPTPGPTSAMTTIRGAVFKPFRDNGGHRATEPAAYKSEAIASTLRHTTQQSSRLCTLDLSCRIFLYAEDVLYMNGAGSAHWHV